MMIAGAKGAIGTTIAQALAAMQNGDATVLDGLTTKDKFASLGDIGHIQMTGWDTSAETMPLAAAGHGVLPEKIRETYSPFLSGLDIRMAPAGDLPLADQVEAIQQDMRQWMAACPEAQPVFVNLLPAACDMGELHRLDTLDEFFNITSITMPDIAYTLAALTADIPIVNFTPNTIEFPLICAEAVRRNVPIAGRDGKTGQTFFKVVLASALKARALYVDGWYSLNILGNADGMNLMDPDRACGKLNNKTNLLDDILQYHVGENYDESSHKVHIDYYPPRGDAKEAWDVIDLKGIFGLPMSLRLNLQGRDSILAAPMAIDLARWAAALKKAGIGGPVADLGFFFKKPVGDNPPLTFEEQLAALDHLEKRIG